MDCKKEIAESSGEFLKAMSKDGEEGYIVFKGRERASHV